jgi:hypothetical protein
VTTSEPAFLVLNEDLHEIARFRLPSPWRGFPGVSPDLKRLAVSERDQVSVIDRSGAVVVEHDRQDRVLCDIHPSGRMFLTTPHVEGPVALHGFPADRLRPKGIIAYPGRGGSGYPLSSHDGTWVTLDGTTLTRWRLTT